LMTIVLTVIQSSCLCSFLHLLFRHKYE